MNSFELTELTPSEVRNNAELMRLYIQFYKDAFFVEPNCAGCTFSTDFNKLKKHNNEGLETKPQQIITTMTDYKLNRKHNSEILTYKLNGRPFRVYGSKITDQFAEAYLKNGTKEEIEKRKEKFDVIPSTTKKSAVEVSKDTSEAKEEVISKENIAEVEKKPLVRKKRGAKKSKK